MGHLLQMLSRSDPGLVTATTTGDGALALTASPAEERVIDAGPIPLSQVTPKFMGILHAESGVSVTPDTAIAASAVFACVNIIASTLAMMAVKVIRIRDRDVRDQHPIARLLNDEPNEFQTAFSFIETMMMNLLLWGNCYAYIERAPDGTPIALYPLRSSLTRPYRWAGGPLVYITNINGQQFTFRPDQIFHVAYMAVDGVYGVAPIQYARNTVGISLALDKFVSKFFGNGGHLGGAVQMPKGMKEDAIKSFAATWKETYAGSDNAFKTAFLPDGMTYAPMGTVPYKAQMLEQRLFQIRELARIYRVPLHKIGDLERATFSNIEHQGIEFKQDTIQPWSTKWEQECNRKLLLEREKGKLRTRFDLTTLTRADTQQLTASLVQKVNAGIVTLNEARAELDLAPVEGGDKLRVPLNMARIDDPAAGGASTDPAPADPEKPAKQAKKAKKSTETDESED